MPEILHKDRFNLLPSAARTATTTSAQARMAKRHTGAIVYMNVSAASGTGGVKAQLRCYDTLGNPYAMHGGGTAKTATGKYAYIVYPGGAAAAGDIMDVSNVPMGEQFDVLVTHGDGSSYTYSVDVELIP